MAPNGPQSGGTQISVVGTAFGVADPTATVLAGSLQCASQSWVSGTTIICGRASDASALLSSQQSLIVTSGGVGTVLGVFTFDGTWRLQCWPTFASACFDFLPNTTADAVSAIFHPNFKIF